ncbi:Haloacid dehalogenase-like hydrolase-domain-containing protein [Lipomyces orientalis]|uniref:Haloacid dehalogenase-like hydrolase-domain-containing protein n=1 Tax=Lipomyces orientalis TaxID=1233043 RepID=A0ACC3TII3_9ASCO
MTAPTTEDEKIVFFFDIDNCLYPRSYKIHDIMAKLIDDYFMEKLDLDFEEARMLHQQYYKDYGLAIEGLVRHHEIDPIEYNSKVDDALPIADILKPDPELHKFLRSIDRSKVKLWLFTNAYKTHASRVIKALDVEDQFDGVTFCDYSEPILICKPKQEMFERAMRDAGVVSKDKCYFVDDSFVNIKGAKEFGWKTTIQYLDPLDATPPNLAGHYEIRKFDEIKKIVPDIFLS